MTEDRPYVLIVDDDLALLEALPQALHLRLNGIQIDTCDSGQEALERLLEHDYDAVISDIKMPGVDGLELLGQIRALRPETPTLLITGHGEDDLAVQALRGGAYDFIKKPINRDYLVAALQRAVNTHQLSRKVHEQQLALELHSRKLERDVQQRTSELVAANEAKDKLLNIVSHELKTPLTSLKGRAQLLRRQLDRDDPRELMAVGLEEMERSIVRMEVLANDLLDSSLIETNMFVLHRRRHDLVQICQHLINEYTAGAGPELTFEVPGEPLEAEVDPNRLGQVLLNLLSNARKYSERGTPISVTLQREGYEARLTVRDQGQGIPESELENIFNQFYRVPDVEVLSGGRGGLGLGLYISRKIVERHGGRIDVESILGEGSSFSVVLPLYVDPGAERPDPALLTLHTQATWTIASN